jgi:hypothetical protein
VTRQSDRAAPGAILEAELVRLTGSRWRHPRMNCFEDMMLSVERHGDICKRYAMLLKP